MAANGEMRFVRTSSMLRAPRLAVLITEEGWPAQARIAVRALSRLWGGHGCVVVPVGADGMDSRLERLLAAYDPDYLAPLNLTVEQMERIRPGAVLLESNGRRLRSPKTRARWIDRFGKNLGAGSLVSDEAVSALSQVMTTFKEESDPATERVWAVDSFNEPGQPLSAAPIDGQVIESFDGTTGNELIDIAFLCRTGLGEVESSGRRLDDVNGFEIWNTILDSDDPPPGASPFASTLAHLVGVSAGYRGSRSPMLVVGDTAEDFAFGLVLHRLVGGAAWLPRLVGASSAVRSAVGDGLVHLTSGTHGPLRVTSLSLSPSDALQRVQWFWDKRSLRLIPPAPLKTTFVSPFSVEVGPARSYAVENAWDRRRGIPVVDYVDGSSEMLTQPPVEWPQSIDRLGLGWIVEHDRHDLALPFSTQTNQAMLLAEGQNPHETFVRVSRGSLAYERGRWDFVASGASTDGRAAAPLLRWPSLTEGLSVAAARSGGGVRLSDAGRRQQTATGLWGSSEVLAGALLGPSRKLLGAFLPPSRENGPYTVGSAHGIGRYGRGYLTFGALSNLAGSAWASDIVRAWVDDLAAKRVLRRGLLLQCGTCGSVDFHTIDLLKQINRCPRCDAASELSHERWRLPHEEPSWFYELHPSVADMLGQHGDLPILAWQEYLRQSRGPARNWFEAEFLNGKGKPLVEFDIVGQVGTRIVLGEVKLGGNLDGSTAAARTRDAEKLLRNAAELGASEVLLASATRWTTGSIATVTAVAQRFPVRVSIIEDLTSGPTKLRYLDL